jgi:ABC-type branched-subunit amino acid transport system substrate-binding protein
MKRILLAALCCAAISLQAEPKLALLGPFGEEKSVETLSAQAAVDASNAVTGSARLKLAVLNNAGTAEGSLAAVRKALADPDVLAVVLHGEAAADKAVLDELRSAGVAAVSASSWAQPRPAEAGTTWLSPALPDLAETAAIYARREAKASQVAVVDNGAPTSVAAAKAFTARFHALGGKVAYEGSWGGDDLGLTRTVKGMATHWPQMVFFAGEAAEAGRLVVAMQDEKALKAAALIGLPSIFEPAFFSTARLKSLRTRALFPCPDFAGTARLMNQIGLAFPRTSPEYRAYVAYAFRKPGRWTSMIYDAVALAARATRNASARPAAAATVAAAQATAVSGTAEALSPTPAVEAPAVGQEPPSRDAVRLALLGIEGYRGIRGIVKFGPSREPLEPKAMVYYALNKVNKKEMHWLEKNYGPPF